MILAKKYPDATFIIIVDGEIFAYGVTRPEAYHALRRLVSRDEADKILNTKPGNAWRKAFLAAMAKVSVKA